MGCLRKYSIFYRRGRELMEVPQRISALSLLLSFSAVKKSSLFISILLLCKFSFAQNAIRQQISLNDNWKTIATNDNKLLPSNSYEVPIDKNWKTVSVPHNWDAYDGYRRLLHGNRHGDSWYRKTFSINQDRTNKRFFLFFEGVSSYATVFLNGKKIGEHAGGRTTFTIEVTSTLR